MINKDTLVAVTILVPIGDIEIIDAKITHEKKPGIVLSLMMRLMNQSILRIYQNTLRSVILTIV